MLAHIAGDYEINPYTGEKYKAYFCPECGQECEFIYVNKYGSAVGCEHCIETVKSYLWEE